MASGGDVEILNVEAPTSMIKETSLKKRKWKTYRKSTGLGGKAPRANIPCKPLRKSAPLKPQTPQKTKVAEPEYFDVEDSGESDDEIEILEDDPLNESELNTFCDICGLCLKSSDELKDHMDSCQKESEVSEVTETADERPVPKFLETPLPEPVADILLLHEDDTEILLLEDQDTADVKSNISGNNESSDTTFEGTQKTDPYNKPTETRCDDAEDIPLVDIDSDTMCVDKSASVRRTARKSTKPPRNPQRTPDLEEMLLVESPVKDVEESPKRKHESSETPRRVARKSTRPPANPQRTLCGELQTLLDLVN